MTMKMINKTRRMSIIGVTLISDMLPAGPPIDIAMT
jgi:hypothetical protein